jgi:hypothetical protein
MKFGLYLQDNMVKDWKAHYIQYDELKRMIRVLAEVESKNLAPESTFAGGRIGFSLTVPPPTNAAAMPIGSKPPGAAASQDGDSDGAWWCGVVWCGVVCLIRLMVIDGFDCPEIHSLQ